MAESFSLGHWGKTSEEILRAQFPLHRACRDGDVEGLAMLLFEAQHGIYEEDSFYGWTPAHWAAYFGKLGCLRKLMTLTRFAVNCNIQTSRFQQTPAHLAAFGGHPQSLLWLVQNDAMVDMQDYLGETAVHKAARTGSMECVSLLTSHGANLLIENNNGLTAGQVARMCGHGQCAQYLEQCASQQRSQGLAPPSLHSNGLCQPAPHDITLHNGATHPNEVPHPNEVHHQNGHINGHLNGQDTDMDCDGPITNGCDKSADITLDCRVSSNIVPVGGRKRSREDTQVVDLKRQKMHEIENGSQFGWSTVVQCREEGSGECFQSSAEDHHKLLMSQHGYINSLVCAHLISNCHGS